MSQVTGPFFLGNLAPEASSPPVSRSSARSPVVVSGSHARILALSRASFGSSETCRSQGNHFRKQR